jgi:DNA (cytosine-5)-methyltransferase 1
MLNGLDLFSGIGGISLALRDYVRPIAYCEIDPYCQAVLLNRMADRSLLSAPIWDNISTLGNESGSLPNSTIDIIYGGSPCQDISVAGHGKGLEGERSGLFFEIVRLAKEIKPKFIFLENVPAITSRGGLRVVREVTEMGYDCRWCCISAASVGALHKRERWFLLAHAHDDGFPTTKIDRGSAEGVCDSSEGGSPRDVANSRCFCEREKDKSERSSSHAPGCSRFWEVEPSVGRVVDGVPFRVDRIRGLGNSVVPQQVKEAFEILMGLK